MGTASPLLASKQKNGGPRAEKQNRLTRIVLLVFSSLLFITIALGLSTGFAVGLKYERIAVPPVELNAGGGSANFQPLPPWRRDISEYNLDMKDWDINAKPTIRNYNFVLSEVTAAPDGKYYTDYSIII
jgi:hypothetical protein